MIRIGIIGARSRNTITDFNLVKEVFFEIYEEGNWIVSGHCPKGGDAFAEKIAYSNGIPILLFPPKKKTKKEYFARNTKIAKFSTIIIACLVRPYESIEEILKREFGGSEDTLRHFRNFHPEGRIIIV
jgi:hypothetical protein